MEYGHFLARFGHAHRLSHKLDTIWVDPNNHKTRPVIRKFSAYFFFQFILTTSFLGLDEIKLTPRKARSDPKD